MLAKTVLVVKFYSKFTNLFHMSRIGKLPITIPEGTTVTQEKRLITIKGPKGELTFKHHKRIKITIENQTITVERSSDDKFDRSLHGLTRTLIANMIEGVTKGFEKKLEINGVGYRAEIQGKSLNLQLGYSHPIKYETPEGIQLTIDKDKKNIIIISGTDKQQVGQTAAKIRSFRKPEPYKGKGIKYIDEIIIRKAGKTAIGGGAPGEGK